MANEYGKQKIQIARGSKEKIPDLKNGELGLATDTNELFIGTENGLKKLGKYNVKRKKINELSSLDKNYRPRPTLVITYDDAKEEDYTEIFPIHQQYDVPGCVAVNSSTFEEEGKLSAEQLKEMVAEGWEVINHGKNHQSLGSPFLEKDANEGDTKLYVNTTKGWKFPKECIVYEENSVEEYLKVTLIDSGEDSEGEYFELESSLEKNIDAWDYYIRLTDDEIRKEVEEGKKELEQYGFNVENYAYSYGEHAEYSRKIVSQYHNSARATSEGAELKGQPYTDSEFPSRLLKTFALETGLSDNSTRDDMDDYLDELANSKKLGITYFHPGTDDLNNDDVEYLIQEAQDKDIDIVIMEEALKRFGNIIEPSNDIIHEIKVSGTPNIFGVNYNGETIATDIELDGKSRIYTYNDLIYFIAVDKNLELRTREEENSDDDFEIAFYTSRGSYESKVAYFEDDSDHFHMDQPGGGIILKSPDDTSYLVTVDDNGDLQTEEYTG